jgi:hypothetical protein
VYRIDDPTRHRAAAPRATESVLKTDWEQRLRQVSAQLGEQPRAELARLLGLPAHVFSLLPVGYQSASRHGPVWLFPERDAAGAVVGLQRRFRNGEKRNLGARGLCIPEGWQQCRGPIFLPEGASDTLALAALGLAAVGRPSNTGGLTHLPGLLAAVAADLHIVVLGENDEREDGAWPGRDGAVQVALELTRALGRPVHSTLPPAGHKDVRAWVLARKMDPTCSDEWSVAGDELEQLLVAAMTNPAAPIELFEYPPGGLDCLAAVPPFPVGLLPDPLAAYVRELAEAMSCPPDFIGVPMLALAGAALGNAWRLEVTATHVQHAALFAAVVGVPGSAKSPALAQVGEPLQQANGEWLAEAQRMRERDGGLGIKSGAAPRRCLVDDFTIESLAPILQANPKGVIVVKDELAGLIHGLNQYKGGRGNDRQALLSVWAGAGIVVDRKSADDPVVIPQPFVAIVGGIQPTVLDSMRKRCRQGVLEDGLIDRFLFAYPELTPAVGESWRVLSDTSRRSWDMVIKRLLDAGMLRQPFSCRRLPLSEAGRQEWESFTLRHAGESNSLDEDTGLQGVWSKMRGYGARLALIMQALRWACGTASDHEVDGDSMRAGAELVDYFKAHARKVHSVLQVDPVQVGAEKIRDWLAERPGITQVTRANLYRALRRQFQKPAALDDPLAVLTELGYLAVLPGSHPLTWVVNGRWERGKEG